MMSLALTSPFSSPKGDSHSVCIETIVCPGPESNFADNYDEVIQAALRYQGIPKHPALCFRIFLLLYASLKPQQTIYFLSDF